MLIALIVAFVWAVLCQTYDLIWTGRGLKAGLAVEGNTLITGIFGDKPTFLQRLAVDGTLRVLLFGVGFIPGGSDYPAVFTALAIGALTVAGVKNIQGARQWQWLFKNPGKTIPVLESVWQQIVGFWG